ncbi:MAG: DinB family protein [Chloroflexi bacterium]|nr:DinB family protein [Chloroflexota bacterium]MBI3040939.1 DinB family protein [Chloroflexota bacterium]
MEAKELILRSLEQSQGYVTRALEGLTQEEAAWRPTAECNSIAFILWHMTRVEDSFVNRVVQHGKELYETEGWPKKLGTPLKASQYSVEELQTWETPKLEYLRNYAKTVREKTVAFIQSATPEKLSEEVVRPNRPTDSVVGTLGRISTEIALHAGQIAYLRGVQRGLDK